MLTERAGTVPLGHDRAAGNEPGALTVPPGLLAVRNGAIGVQHIVPACGAPTWAEVDLDAIAVNVQLLRAHIGTSAQVMAVVKANAYGHGAVAVGSAALEAGAAWLAVGRLDEALELRASGIEAPVLIMGHIPSWAAESCVALDLACTLNDRTLAEALSDEAVKRAKRAMVHLEVDTGLSRYGLVPEEALPFAEWLVRLPGVVLQGLYTHFAAADEEDLTFTHRQLELFERVVRELRAAGIRPRLLHAANSAATLALPQTHLDLVRTGGAMYGLVASATRPTHLPLRPALTLKTQLIRVWDAPAGTHVSYGCTYWTPHATRLALLAAGYGDGLSRRLSNRGSALVHSHRVPLVGRVCMDLTVADVGAVGAVAIGDEAVLIGRQGDETITAEEVAALTGGLNYEVLTGVSARVPRLYFAQGQLVGLRTLNGMHPVA